MEHASRDDVNYLVVGQGILNNTAGILDVAGKGDVPGSHGGKIVSFRAKRAAWERLNPRIQSGELKNQDAIWIAAREELEKVLQDPDGHAEHRGEAATRPQEGNGDRESARALPVGWVDDGGDRPKTHRSVLVGVEEPND